MSDMIVWLRALVLAGTELVCLHAATISGVVSDPVNFPVDRSDVWAVTEDCLQPRHVVTDERGRYSFEGLRPDTYHVFATHPGFWLIGDRVVRLGDDAMANL